MSDEFGAIPPRGNKTNYNALLAHGLVSSPDFIIRKSGSLYQALHGSTKKVEYENADIDVVAEGAIDDAPEFGLIFFKHVPVNKTITIGQHRRQFAGHVYAANALDKMFTVAGVLRRNLSFINLIADGGVSEGDALTNTIFDIGGLNTKFDSTWVANFKQYGIFADPTSSTNELQLNHCRITGYYNEDTGDSHTYAGGDTSVGVYIGLRQYDNEIHDTIIRYCGSRALTMLGSYNRLVKNHFYCTCENLIYNQGDALTATENDFEGTVAKEVIYNKARAGVWLGKINISDNTIRSLGFETDNTYSVVKFEADAGQRINRITMLNNQYAGAVGKTAKQAVEMTGGATLHYINVVTKEGDMEYVNAAGIQCEASGQAYFANGTYELAIPHGLYDVPTDVTFTPRHAEVADATLSTYDGTNLNLEASAPVSDDRYVLWHAKCYRSGPAV